jgi:hypothetical protein
MNLEQIISKLFNLQKSQYHGIKEAQITRVEKKLNIQFPETLRNFYLLFGNNKKININSELFRIEDIYIENGQYIVIGKPYMAGNYFAIDINHLGNNNPIIYPGSYVRDEGSLKGHYEWEIDYEDYYENTEEFLLQIVIASGLDGGLKHLIKIDGALFPNSFNTKIIEMNEIESISCPYMPKYYTDDYTYVLETWSFERYQHSDFGTEDTRLYKEVKAALDTIGMKVKKDDRYLDYKIHKKPFHPPVLRFYSGDYDRGTKNQNFVLVPEDSAFKFLDILRRANAEFDYYGTDMVYNKEQIAILITGLTERLSEMKNNKNFCFVKKNTNLDYYSKDNVDFRRYKKQILKMFMDLIQWLDNVQEDKITILGV